MNGPIPEADANINRRPKTSKIATIGINHHIFCFHRNESSSPTTPKFDFMLLKKAFIMTSRFTRVS
jgi:hypothetical protein